MYQPLTAIVIFSCCRYSGPMQCAKDVLAKDGLVGFMKVSTCLVGCCCFWLCALQMYNWFCLGVEWLCTQQMYDLNLCCLPPVPCRAGVPAMLGLVPTR
jgi:hypothetical protein